jgi:hypothetical protein
MRIPTPNVRDTKATALAIITFLIRPSIFLVLGLAIGYGIGFTDAFRDADTLGTRVSRAVYKIRPEAVSDGIYQRASTIRDTIHRKSGAAVLDTLPF